MLIGSYGFANENPIAKTTKESTINFSFEEAKFDNLLGTCSVTVTFYNADGEVTGSRLHTFYNVNIQAECSTWATVVKLKYNSKHNNFAQILASLIGCQLIYKS